MDEDKKDIKKPDVIINNSGKAFKSVKTSNRRERRNHGGNFLRTVVTPFICGALGAIIVIGTCLGVPSIRETLLGNSFEAENLESKPIDYSNMNTNLISLSGFSETGTSVEQKVLPSIVGITVEYKVNSIFMNTQTTAEAQGSGIIISEDGYILTNNHVINSASNSIYYEIDEASKVKVYLHNDKNEYEAKVVGTDELTDLAVIKIEKTGLTAAELGNSDTIQVGEFAMAVGNPLGMKSSVTSGMISAVNREVTGSDGKVYTLIQTDAAINSGNSGGALVNSQGQVIGINTLKVSATGVEGMGFAIPINSAKPIYEDLIQFNKVRRPYIRIYGRDLNEKTAAYYKLVEGIYIVRVEEYAPAERAGIRIGDIIIKADGKDVKTMNELNEIKNSHEIGDTMTIVINREGKEQELTVTLTEQP